MEPLIFNGKLYSDQEMMHLRKRIKDLVKKKVTPKLVWIQVGNDESSKLYGKIKSQAANKLNIDFQSYQATEIEEAVEFINQANSDSSIHGLMVQLPMYLRNEKVNENVRTKVLQVIASNKDVDCLTPHNLGLVMSGKPNFLPATVVSVMKILDFYQSNMAITDSFDFWMKSKVVTVVGGGLEIGRPLVSHISNLGATVLWARSSAKQNLGQLTNLADIVISAVGKPGLIKSEMVKKGCVVIDVGSPKGDVDFDLIKDKCNFITPVPGGVGPLTVLSLMENVVTAAENNSN